MSYGICNLPVIPLKGKPSHRSEWVSQLLFGEGFEVLGREGDWLRIQTVYDHYEGWIDGKQQTEISETFFDDLKCANHYLTDLTGHSLCLKIGHNELVHLLPCSTLPNLENDRFSMGTFDYLFLGIPMMPDVDSFLSHVEETARFYLNTPYVWGGRSLFGMDCSGFVQIVYKHFGLKLPRDAYQQAEVGHEVGSLEDAKIGDLAFFDNDEGRIDHVGMLLGQSEIIHASGRVKIDRIDEHGIFSGDLNRYTHKLRIIKRVVL